MIENFINRIRKIIEVSYTPDYKTETVYEFSGDGEDDFVMYSYEASKEVTEDYINYCKTQIELAYEYLKTKE